MWKFLDLPWHERRIYSTVTSFCSSSFFLQLLECLNGCMCGDNLTMKFPPYFQNYTGLKVLVTSLTQFTIVSLNKLILGCKPHWFTKRKKKNNLMWEVVARRCSAKNFPKNFSKFTEKYLSDNLFLTLLKVWTPSSFQLY